MKNKQGLEFSIGMIVTIIIAIVVFILAISFIFKWFGKAETLKAEIDRQTEEQILTVLRQGTSLIAVPLNIKTARKGEAVTFGIGVRNVLERREFSGSVSFSGAYYPDGRQIDVDETFLEQEWLGAFNIIPTFTLSKNEQKIIPLLVKVGMIKPGKPAVKGDYVFNVCIFPSPEHLPCDPGDPSVMGQVYTNKVYQIVVKVE